MYLRKALILESGSLKDIEINFEFTEAGLPKPLVIVGRNGSGKSNFLSFVTDALIEVAAKKFTDVAKPNPNGQFGHQWHRVIGGQTFRLGSAFELAILEFYHNQHALTYASKGGLLPFASVTDRIASYQASAWPDNGPHKEVNGQLDSIEEIYSNGCYVSFQNAYDEVPYWSRTHSEDNSAPFVDRFQNLLRKPITISAALNGLRPWIVDVIMDSLVDFNALLAQQSQAQGSLNPALLQALRNTVALTNLNTLVGTVLNAPNAKLVRTGRGGGSRKILVTANNSVILPSLDAFSAGQARLLGVFGTILRYADAADVARSTSEMEGIVVVDEIDAHLHSDLQHDVLPSLMKLFPRVQFILTSHAPLFPLGMEKVFGSTEFTLLEFPSATRITAERFSEFLASFEYLKQTKAFEDSIIETAKSSVSPLVLCEGQTDPKYLVAAAELLGFNHLLNSVGFDWIGVVDNGQSRDGGAGQLRQARKIFQNNPLLMSNDILLLFDCDQNDSDLDDGRLHVRKIAKNVQNKKCDRGIENLLAEDVFTDEFFDTSEIPDGPNLTTKRVLNKVRLCDHLCDVKRDPADFEAFRAVLEDIERCLLS